ncbi:DUF7768 domain-containing protein [Actinomyces minihominis]|uniref:DUF7768 domain-containing protein n=1 Tax=Actinomyces minihominis TaxID=2002838 RepID=UPI003F9E6EEC
MRPVVALDGRRNAEGYMDMTAFEGLKRAQRTRFGWRPFVYICSPYSGDVEANVELARRFCRVAVQRRTIPVASHLLFPQFMDDAVSGERELAMFMNRIVLSRMDAIWVYADRISTGMRQEIEWAYVQGTPIKYFNTGFGEIKR